MTARAAGAIGVVAVFVLLAPAGAVAGDVLQHHASGARDGRYVDSNLTQAAVQNLRRDTSFIASLTGPIYAQPLYVSNGPGGRAAFIVATEQNTVVALDAATGSSIWARSLGTAVPASQLVCGNIDPLGITGTPVIDAAARVVYLDAMTTPDDGTTKQHRIFALSLDDGSTLDGWPFDVSGLTSSGITFNSAVQNQRGALILNGGFLYVPYGAHVGDCADYHGWVVAVPVNNPSAATAWVVKPSFGGSWAPGGLATDGASVFAATGNADAGDTWGGGEAIVRLGPGGSFSGNPMDFFTPSNWRDLDHADLDIGGSGPVLIDVPGATPSQLIVALGKNGVAYLLDRTNLGGVGTGDGTEGEGVQSLKVATGYIINAAAAYTAPSGTYVVFQTLWGTGVGCPGTPGDFVALKIGPTAPPSLSVAWCANTNSMGSPIATTIDGTTQPIVWIAGAEGDDRLHALDGETGATLFSGGGPLELMGLVRRFQTPIVVDGRVFVAAEDGLYAFTVRPPDPPDPSPSAVHKALMGVGGLRRHARHALRLLLGNLWAASGPLPIGRRWRWRRRRRAARS